MGSPFLLSKKCKALLVTQLQSSCGSISRETKVSLGRARAEVHRTSWHPSRRTFYVSLRSSQNQGPPDLLTSRDTKVPLGRVRAEVHRTS